MRSYNKGFKRVSSWNRMKRTIRNSIHRAGFRPPSPRLHPEQLCFSSTSTLPFESKASCSGLFLTSRDRLPSSRGQARQGWLPGQGRGLQSPGCLGTCSGGCISFLVETRQDASLVSQVQEDDASPTPQESNKKLSLFGLPFQTFWYFCMCIYSLLFTRMYN